MSCASASSATVYKWVDDNGVVHYSDQPNPKAQKLEIAGAQTYGAQAASRRQPPRADRAARRSDAAPVCAIDTPAAGQVFLDTYSITGHVTLAHLGEGSQATLRWTARIFPACCSRDGSFALSQVERGDHTLTLQVTNDRGEVTCQANAVTFSIRQRAGGAAGGAGHTCRVRRLRPRRPGTGRRASLSGPAARPRLRGAPWLLSIPCPHRCRISTPRIC